MMICDVCDEIISKSKSKHNYPTHLPNGTPLCSSIIWNQIFCPNHLLDGTPLCHGCLRLKTKNNLATYINLGDGREICADCYSTAIFDVRQCEPLIRKIKQLFSAHNMDIWEDIPVFLVDVTEMARLSGEEGPVFGMTLTEEDDGGPIITRCSRKGHDMVAVKEHQSCSGLRIAVLFGLPKIMTGAILAHEMMHVWLQFEGIGGELETKDKEGMCQVMGVKWLDWLESNILNIDNHYEITNEIKEEEEAYEFERKLIKTYKFVAQMHGSYEYGQGFRDAQWAVATFGLQSTLDHIFANKKLPYCEII